MDKKTEEIVNAGLELFRKYGIKSVSMDDIASAMGISKKTIYKNVRDKRHLVELVIDKVLEGNKFHGSKMNSEGNAVQDYFYVYEQVKKMINEANFSAEYDLQKYYPDLFKRLVESRKKKMETGIKANLKKGVEEGFYRKELDIDIVAKLNVMLSESMHDYEFLTQNRSDLIHIMDVNFDYHLHAILNEKGRNEYYKIQKNNKL